MNVSNRQDGGADVVWQDRNTDIDRVNRHDLKSEAAQRKLFSEGIDPRDLNKAREAHNEIKRQDQKIKEMENEFDKRDMHQTKKDLKDLIHKREIDHSDKAMENRANEYCENVQKAEPPYPERKIEAQKEQAARQRREQEEAHSQGMSM